MSARKSGGSAGLDKQVRLVPTGTSLSRLLGQYMHFHSGSVGFHVTYRIYQRSPKVDFEKWLRMSGRLVFVGMLSNH